MTSDEPGEAQYYNEYYCQDGDMYDITGSEEGNKLCVKDGVALFVTGEGKVNSVLAVTNIMNNSRFDFSDTLIRGL